MQSHIVWTPFCVDLIWSHTNWSRSLSNKMCSAWQTSNPTFVMETLYAFEARLYKRISVSILSLYLKIVNSGTFRLNDGPIQKYLKLDFPTLFSRHLPLWPLPNCPTSHPVRCPMPESLSFQPTLQLFRVKWVKLIIPFHCFILPQKQWAT